MTADLLQIATPQNPVVKQEYEIIDWKAAAAQCVRFHILHFAISNRCRRINSEFFNKFRQDEAIRQQWEKCPKLIKNFYKEHPDVTKLSSQAVDLFRELNNNITVSRAFPDKPLADVPIPNPVMTFEQCFSDYPDMLSEIKKQGFEKPSPIQSQAWPVLLKGEDLIGIAQTGTGKTLVKQQRFSCAGGRFVMSF